MVRFGYSPKEAERIKDRLDVQSHAARQRIEVIGLVVPDVGAVTTRLETLSEEVAEVVTDLQAIVDQRTDGDRSPR